MSSPTLIYFLSMSFCLSFIILTLQNLEKNLSAMEKIESGVPFQSEPELKQDPDNLFK